MHPAGVRLSAFGLLAVAVVAAWQASKLQSWGFDGPGPGLFPQTVVAIAIVLALIVCIVPGEAPANADDEFSVETIDDAEKRTFFIYALALIWMAVGVFFAGFILTTFVLAITLLRFADRRNWLTAILFGAGLAIVVLVCFGWLLGVNLPEAALDRFILSALR